MTTHDRDKIIAIAEEVKANNDMFGDFSVALYAIAFEDGAASRDAEVVSLTNQRDYEYVRAENAEQERDQLREQVKMLRCERDAARYKQERDATSGQAP